MTADNDCNRVVEELPSQCAVRFTKIDDRQKTLTENVASINDKVSQIHHILCGNGEEGLGEQVRTIVKEQLYQNDVIEDLKVKLTNQVWSWWQKALAIIVVCVTLVTLAIRIVLISGTK